METETNGEITPKKPKLDEFWVRLITGTVYCVVLIIFYALKIFVSKLFFDALLIAFTAIGTFEMVRAFKEKLTLEQRIIVMVFAILVPLTYAISDFIFADLLDIVGPLPGGNPAEAEGRNYSILITCGVFIAGLTFLFSLLVFRIKETPLESTGYALFALLYPSTFLTVLSVCNHLELYSELALLFVFVLCPFADSFALLFGRWFGKKVPAKLAPDVSPNKTLIGGLGGLVGGAIGAVVILFCYYGLTLLDQFNITAEPLGGIFSLNWSEALFFIGLGILTAGFSQLGDLVESAIKRKLGIKDMGKLLPGHGGILDRIDSSLFAGLIICLVMVIRIMIFG